MNSGAYRALKNGDSNENIFRGLNVLAVNFTEQTYRKDKRRSEKLR